jgi:hypothetical protein
VGERQKCRQGLAMNLATLVPELVRLANGYIG